MSAPAQLEGRVRVLEDRMEDVEGLARGTDEEVANWRGTLNNHTETINTVRLDQVDLIKKVDKGFAEISENFAKVDNGFAEAEKKFELLRKGQEQITELLTRHLGEPDEETRAGGADE